VQYLTWIDIFILNNLIINVTATVNSCLLILFEEREWDNLHAALGMATCYTQIPFVFIINISLLLIGVSEGAKEKTDVKEGVLLIIGLCLNFASILVLVICTWYLKIYYHNHPPEKRDGQASESDIANIAAKQESSRLEQDSFRQEVLELLKSAAAVKESPVTKTPLTSSSAHAPPAGHLVLAGSSSVSISAPPTESVQVYHAPVYYSAVRNAEVIRNPLPAPEPPPRAPRTSPDQSRNNPSDGRNILGDLVFWR